MNNENGNEKEKVQIKIERHKWPDELKKEQKRSRIIIGAVAALILSFGFGWFTNTIFTGSTNFANNNPLSKFNSVYEDVLQNWYFGNEMEKPDKEIIDNAIKGMLKENGDPHTSYMTQEETIALNESINMSFVGIGVTFISNQEVNMITKVFKDSPAEKAGMLAGDVIEKVNDQTIVGSQTPVKDLILGEAGSTVSIDVLRQGKPLRLDIQRGQVNAIANGQMLDNNVAYLEMSSFGESLASITEDYLKSFKAQGATSLVIDLRDNGGGLLSAIEQLGRLFLKNGDVVYKETFKNGKEKTYEVKDSISNQYPFEKIVVLVNENTASASEVLALALRENLGAQLVGTKTYGKGTVQTQRIYNDKTSLKVTIAEWLSPSGKSINGEGIVPDIEEHLPKVMRIPYPQLKEQTIAPDSVNGAVVFVQEALAYLNRAPGRLDGYYDAQSVAAYQKFMAEKGVESDGVITAEGAKLLYSEIISDWAMHKYERDNQLLKAIEAVK